ncbi:chaperonin 10-like protein [Limtongia smithiae]|uniref:chaperonin 10-like protein n=1 Tax=Limtongia smithiae TaxID=1125753 RepID=UPI0034CEF44D
MATMKAVVYPKYTVPSGYNIAVVNRPDIVGDKDVLIKVYAAGINPVDVKTAEGQLKHVIHQTFPAQFGYDLSGVVAKVGKGVTEFVEGDQVYSILPAYELGAFQEYALTTVDYVARKPKNITFEEAASLPLAALTSLQSLLAIESGLAGKTLLVKAGLSGTGSMGVQLAKNVFGASKVITTLSTSKIPKLESCIGAGIVDEVIDYTKEDPGKIIPAGSLDAVYDTVGNAFASLHLIKRGGSLITITGIPASSDISEAVAKPLPWYVSSIISAAGSVSRYRAKRRGVTYKGILLHNYAGQLNKITEYVEEGKLKPVVGRVVDFADEKALKEAFAEVLSGKGLIGKTVIKFAE